MPISFSLTKEESEIVDRIAVRAKRLYGTRDGETYKFMDARMDIAACHANGCPLRLEELLGADDANFAHDVFGIRRHLDREHDGHLKDNFLPRFSKPQYDSA